MTRWLALCFCLLACDDPQPAAPPVEEEGASELDWIELHDPGAEPRRRPRLSFRAGLEERATLTFDSVLSLAEGEPVAERLSLELAVRYPREDRVQLEVREARTTAGDIPAIGMTVGTTAALTFYPIGASEDPEVAIAPGANPRAATYVRGALLQVLPALVATFPEEPVGEGARWGGGRLEFTLVADEGDALRVERRTGLDRVEVLPDGRRVEAAEEQVYRIDARLDRVARSIEAELLTRGDGAIRRRTELRFEVDR